MRFRPLRSEAGRTHVCGHRGHSIDAPENTLPALVAAARHGATCCEIDVVLSADDEIVLLHDMLLDRTTDGRGLAGDLTLAEIRMLDAGVWFGEAFAGTRVPTLAEALAVARAEGLGLLVEIKERRRIGVMIEQLAALVEREDAFGDVLAISFDHPSLVALRARAPEMRTELITHARHVAIDAIALRAGAASVAIETDMFHPEDAAALHAAGVAVRVTIPRPEKIARAEAAGLDPLGPILKALAAGLIDCLAADDVAAARDLVRSAEGL